MDTFIFALCLIFGFILGIRFGVVIYDQTEKYKNCIQEYTIHPLAYGMAADLVKQTSRDYCLKKMGFEK
jgi:hypothetical protein